MLSLINQSSGLFNKAFAREPMLWQTKETQQNNEVIQWLDECFFHKSNSVN